MLTLDIFEIAKLVIEEAKKRDAKIAVAESCTGGMLSCYLTAVPGSSEAFDRGYIPYTSRAKREVLLVRSKILMEHGLVSEQTALEMLSGVFELSSVHVALSITGAAGPAAVSESEPVGLVYIGYGSRLKSQCKKFTFLGDRHAIREQATREGLKLLLRLLRDL